MPQSFAAVYLHVVFSTKNRDPWLTPELAPRDHEYVGEVVRGCGCRLLIAGGMPDHIHLLVSLGREVTISGLVREVKSASSRWVHDTFADRRGFAWQAGYGAFSVSPSRLETVTRHITNQEEHHRDRTFQDEFRAMLTKVFQGQRSLRSLAPGYFRTPLRGELITRELRDRGNKTRSGSAA
jgi:REP element-mobilizing transposase RayT